MAIIEHRICNTHGETRFAFTDNRFVCMRCRQDRVNTRRRKLKVMSIEYKGGKCEKCGYDRCIGALEFHHLDPTQKDFAISSTGNTRAWDKIQKELDKCILVCSNCHREIHETINHGSVA